MTRRTRKKQLYDIYRAGDLVAFDVPAVSPEAAAVGEHIGAHRGAKVEHVRGNFYRVTFARSVGVYRVVPAQGLAR